MGKAPLESRPPETKDKVSARRSAARTAAVTRAFLPQWVALGVVLLILAGIIANALNTKRLYIESVAQDRLSLGAQSVAHQVERRLASIDSALRSLRRDLHYLRTQPNKEALVSMHLQTFQETQDDVRTVMILDNQGRVTESSRGELVGMNFREQPFFQTVLNKPDARTLYVSVPFITTLNTYTLNLSRATFDSRNEFSGIVSATLDPEELKPILASLRYTEDISVGLIHGTGKILLYLASPEIPLDTNVAAPGSFFSRHIESGSDHSLLSGSSPILRNERLAAVHTINPAVLAMDEPLVIVVSQELGSILLNWRGEVRTQSILFTLLASLASLGLFFHQRRQRAFAISRLVHQREREKDVDRLTLATEASGTGIWELDLESKALTWDDTMFRLYGKERKVFQATYSAWLECILPEDRLTTETDLQRSIDQGKAFETLFRIRRGDDDIRIIDARARVYRDQAGHPTRMIGINMDITQQHRIEQSLRESKDFALGILNSLIQHIAVLDEHGVIISVNQAWEDFSTDNSESGQRLVTVGLNYLGICSAALTDNAGEEAAAALAGIREVLSNKRSEFALEYPCHSPTEKRWFIMHVTPLHGSVSGAVVAHENITERKLAELRLKESLTEAQRFRDALDNVSSYIYLKDANSRYVYANRPTLTLFGCTAEELVGCEDARFFPPETVKRLHEVDARVFSGESTTEQIEVTNPSNGSRIYLEIKTPIYSDDENRTIWGLCGISTDITELRRAEEEIERAQRVTQQFIDHLPGTAYVKDENLRVLMANRAFQTVLGMDPAAMIGKTNSELFPGDFGTKLDADDRRVLKTGQSTFIEETFEGRFFESSKFVIEVESGRHLLGGITMEVTQRQRFIERQEALLKISELGGMLPEKEFLGQGLELVQQLTRSQIGFLHFVNDDQQSIELVTWTAGALKGCTAVHDSHYPIGLAGIWADCARNKEISVFNDYGSASNKKGLPDGHAPLHRLISVPVVEEGRVRMILGIGNKKSDYDDYDCVTAQTIGNDLWRIVRRVRAETSLKQKLEELTLLNVRLDETNNKLLQSEKLASIGQLAAGVAHEINNPIGYVSSNLNSLSGYVDDLLAIDAAYDEIEKHFGASIPYAFERARQLKVESDHDFIVSDIRHLLAESREGLERVQKIVQDLKDFSRVGGAGWQRVSLHQGLESTLNIVWNEIKYKAEVDREYGDLPEIYCNPSQINQVFMNLLTNAAQSIEGHGHIVLRSGREGDVVWVEVQDDGAGIAPEDLERIFEPFYTTKPVGKGTGLGLSLSWGIVQRHHGKIEVHSTPGRGTTFRVTLPIVPAEPAEPMESIDPTLDTEPPAETAS